MHDCPRNSIQARYVDKNRWGEGEEKRETWIDTWIDGIYIRESRIDTATLVYMYVCVCVLLVAQRCITFRANGNGRWE